MRLTKLPVLIACVACLWAAGPASAVEERIVAVVIYPFDFSGIKFSGDEKIDVRRYLGTRMTIEGVYKVMPEDQIRKDLVSDKLKSWDDGCDDTCRKDLTQRLSADKAVSVKVVKEGTICRITGDLFDVVREITENAADVESGCGYREIKNSMKQVAAQLSGRKGPDILVEPPPEELPPPPEIQGGAGGFDGGGAPPPVKAEAGYLSVEGTPKGARVDISGPKTFGANGKSATSLPLRPIPVPAGEYRVSVSMTGYDPEEKSVRVYADATEIVKVELIQSSGHIQISGKPNGAKSRLECQKGFVRDFGLPAATSPWTVSVPRGQCRLVVERDGYEKYEQTFEVAGGATVRQSVELKRDMYASGGGSTGTAGTKWVRLPGGTFQMGSNSGSGDEKPVHSVTLSAFEIAATEVTVGQYRQCVQAGACTEAHFDDGTCYVWTGSEWKQGVLPQTFRGDNQPVVCVDWHQATAYANWVGGRLPTEAEWEYAARSGGRNQEYPWGNQKATCSYAVIDDGGNGCGQNSTWPVCSKSAGNTFQGLCDMAGNVWEWVSDWYDSGYYAKSPSSNPTGPSSGSNRVIRGGSWLSFAGDVRAANRGSYGPGDRSYALGLRPARSVR